MHYCALCATKAYNVEGNPMASCKVSTLAITWAQKPAVFWDFFPFATAIMNSNRWLNNLCNIKQPA